MKSGIKEHLVCVKMPFGYLKTGSLMKTNLTFILGIRYLTPISHVHREGKFLIN